MRNVADTVLEFAEALNNNSLHDSSLPCFVPDASDELPAAAATTAAATTAAASTAAATTAAATAAAAAATAPGTAEVGSATAEVGATQQGDNPDQAMSVPEQQLPAPEQPIQESEPASDMDIDKQTHEAQPQLSAYQRHSYEPVTLS